MIRLGHDAVILTSDEAIELLGLIQMTSLAEKKKMRREQLEFISEFRSVVRGFYPDELS